MTTESFGASMSELVLRLSRRLDMLGLATDSVPFDTVNSAIGALACFPMYMVANVHRWTGDWQFKVPLFDIPGLEAIRESIAIGAEESRLPLSDEHRETLGTLLSTGRHADRIIYEYALETLKDYLTAATPAVADSLRVAVARMIVAVAQASGEGVFGTGEKVSPEERTCVGQIAAELRLAETPKAAEILASL
jgi:hypothetical protein